MYTLIMTLQTALQQITASFLKQELVIWCFIRIAGRSKVSRKHQHPL